MRGLLIWLALFGATASACMCALGDSSQCPYLSDGDCDDGGAGSEYASCSAGSDCVDCGPRCAPPPSVPSDEPQLPPSPLAPPPPLLPPVSPLASGALWGVVQGSEHCAVHNGSGLAEPFASQQCLHDGYGAYASNVGCTIQAFDDILVSAAAFATEATWDFVRIGAESFSGTVGPRAVGVRAGETIEWVSDGSVASDGFILCAVAGLASPPPPVPPLTPSPPPRAPGDGYVCVDRADCTWTSDGVCYAGGAGAVFAACGVCGDCDDCGSRLATECVEPPPPSPSPPSPPAAPPPTAECGTHFCLLAASIGCELANATAFPAPGSCVSDGAGPYAPNSHCELRTTADAVIRALQYEVEARYDHFAIPPCMLMSTLHAC